MATTSGGGAMCYCSFWALPHDHKKGLVGPPVAVRATYRLQSQNWQNIFFDDIAGTRPVSLNTATIPTFERLAYHGWHTSKDTTRGTLVTYIVTNGDTPKGLLNHY